MRISWVESSCQISSQFTSIQNVIRFGSLRVLLQQVVNQTKADTNYFRVYLSSRYVVWVKRDAELAHDISECHMATKRGALYKDFAGQYG